MNRALIISSLVLTAPLYAAKATGTHPVDLSLIYDKGSTTISINGSGEDVVKQKTLRYALSYDASLLSYGGVSTGVTASVGSQISVQGISSSEAGHGSAPITIKNDISVGVPVTYTRKLTCSDCQTGDKDSKKASCYKDPSVQLYAIKGKGRFSVSYAHMDGSTPPVASDVIADKTVNYDINKMGIKYIQEMSCATLVADISHLKKDSSTIDGITNTNGDGTGKIVQKLTSFSLGIKGNFASM